MTGGNFGWEKENQKNERLFYSCFDSIIFYKRERIVLPNRQTQLIFVEESQKAVNCGVGGRGCIVSRSLALDSLADT